MRRAVEQLKRGQMSPPHMMEWMRNQFGHKTLVAVKPFEIAVRDRLDLTLQQIAACVPAGFTNEVALFTDRTISRQQQINNSRYHAIRRIDDHEAELAVEGVVRQLNSPVKMYAFVSGKYGRLDCKNGEGKCPGGLGDLEGLNVLRIKETDFRSFLTKWVDWLRVSHIAAKA